MITKPTRTEALETACAMADIYEGINPDLGPAMKNEVAYWLTKSILGDTGGMWEVYAKEMIGWLERNIKSGQYTQFKACQNNLREWGVI